MVEPTEAGASIDRFSLLVVHRYYYIFSVQLTSVCTYVSSLRRGTNAGVLDSGEALICVAEYGRKTYLKTLFHHDGWENSISEASSENISLTQYRQTAFRALPLVRLLVSSRRAGLYTCIWEHTRHQS